MEEWRKNRKSQIGEIASFHRLVSLEVIKRYDSLKPIDIDLILAMNTISDDYGGYFTNYLLNEYTGYNVQVVGRRVFDLRNESTEWLDYLKSPTRKEINKYVLGHKSKAVAKYYIRCMKNVIESRICSYNPSMSPMAYSLLHFDTGLRRKDRVKLDEERIKKLERRKKKEQSRKRRGLK